MNSKIEWTGITWNPVTGCDKISAGCKFCYAEIMTKRLVAMKQPKYAAGFGTVVTHPKELKRPYTWSKPQTVFVNSMSDLFHKDVPLSFIKQTFKVMNDLPQHIFQVLTKRSERLESLSKSLNWTANIWQGVSIENEKVLNRLRHLKNTSAAVKFLSLEPLIGPLNKLDLSSIDWVIVGGESGNNPRPIKLDWVIDIMEQCRAQKVPFFFKQWGGKNKKKAGRLLNGKIYDEMPLQYHLQQIINKYRSADGYIFYKGKNYSNKDIAIAISNKTGVGLDLINGIQKLINYKTATI